MSWRARLPRLPRGWSWVRLDVVYHQVLVHNCAGLWFWMDRDAAESAEDAPLLHDILRRAKAEGLRGWCQLIPEGLFEIPPPPRRNETPRQRHASRLAMARAFRDSGGDYAVLNGDTV